MKDSRKALFWDLDGTLSNSVEGIFKSLAYAFEAFDKETPDQEVLQEFLGPPIVYSLQHFCGIDTATSEAMYAKFRERYSTVGKFENHLYDGMEEVLQEFKMRGYYMAVATAKPEVFAKQILDHFQITNYFDNIVGADYDLNRIHKMDILDKATRDFAGLEEYNGLLLPHKSMSSFMIGDRRYDMEAAQHFGCTPVGVIYGFGTEEELRDSGAELLAESPKDLLEIL